jgi:hypothetical protein
MIISASRRTDIPAFYARWFMNRIRAGYCTVPNPSNPKHVIRVSLAPGDVDVIVFWTRNAGPLLGHLDELDARGFPYYFQYTVMDNRDGIDGDSPSIDAAVGTFCRLSARTGAGRVIWRYDPIAFTATMDADFHARTFASIADRLRGATNRVVISIVDRYKKAGSRLSELEAVSGQVDACPSERKRSLLRDLVEAAARNGLEIFSCAEEEDFSAEGIRPGKCVDDLYIEREFGLGTVSHRKDASQRPACGCAESRDIGMYDSCLFGCKYCYATSSFVRARMNHEEHDPESPSLIGHYEVTTTSSS